MFSIFYSTISFLSSALVLFLLPWFIRFRSVPGLFTIGWLFVVNFLYGLNAAVFTGERLLGFPAYCDVATKLLMGMQIVVPTAMLCYTFSIHDWMVRPKERDLSVKLREYRSYFHAILCSLAPIVYMSLHIAAQGHRFDLVKNVGCIPSSSSTALSWVLIWQILIVPFTVLVIYGFFAFKYSWKHHRKYYAEHMTTWELIDSDLLFTKAPFGIIRIVRLSGMIVVVMLCTICTPYYTLSVLYQADHISIAQKPDFYRVEIFDSLSNASSSVTTMRLFLWSGPLYSVLLFAASIDKSVIESYPFVFKKYVLRRPVGANPDPSPGIDLSSLTPVPVRKHVHRRVIRKSRQYDPPLSILDFDIPLPPRPHPGYRANAMLPPVPTSAPTPQQGPRKPEVAYVKDVRGSCQRSLAPKRGSREYKEAICQYVEANVKFPMYIIPESPPLAVNNEPSARTWDEPHTIRDKEQQEQDCRTPYPNDRLFRDP
ncbi:hypothetical protein ACEPAF_9022 [Sanghuangporus sanghuang]